MCYTTWDKVSVCQYEPAMYGCVSDGTCAFLSMYLQLLKVSF